MGRAPYPNLDQAATADLISRLCDFAFVISRDGEITHTMTSPFLAPRLDLSSWNGQQFKDTLTKESVPKFEARLAEFKEGQKERRPVELNHRATDQQAELPVRYTYHCAAARRVYIAFRFGFAARRRNAATAGGSTDCS